MKIIALTGSIGMGKSTAAAMLRRLGVPVYCADEAVHGLMRAGGKAVEQVGKLHPAALKKTPDNKAFIDRAVLGKAAFHDAKLMTRLEAILHPLVRLEEKKFIEAQRKKRSKLVVIDIPLLFETKGEKRADKIIVVTAPAFVQAGRVLLRPGMTREKLRGILARQMPDAEKRKRADIVLHTGLGRHATFQALRRIVNAHR